MGRRKGPAVWTCQGIDWSDVRNDKRTAASPENVITLPLATAAQLNMEARRRGMTLEEMAVRLLRCVANDRLYDAVLDDEAGEGGA